jgi:hypothetical protein
VGSDNLFHKRKARSAKTLARKSAKKSDYDSILIVCEGTKTEPNYFKELIDELELNTANVQTISSPSTCPRQLVEFAVELSKSEEHDFIYCVFDKDSHAKYNEAKQLIAVSPRLVSAHSVPCFEYWLILHFDATTAPFYGNASKSPGAEALSKLKKYIPDYEKGDAGTFSLVMKRMDKAMESAIKVNASAVTAGTDNPSTYVVDLIKVLVEIREKMDAA